VIRTRPVPRRSRRRSAVAGDVGGVRVRSKVGAYFNRTYRMLVALSNHDEDGRRRNRPL